MEKHFNKKDGLNPKAEIIWRQIFNHEIESLDQADLSARKALFATTHCAKVSYMMEEDHNGLVFIVASWKLTSVNFVR